jgi:antitoxin ParD1/3/4
MKNTSISLGHYFDQFVSSQIAAGEDEETKMLALKSAIQEGLDSPRIENFDFDENLKLLKKSKNG